MLNHKQKQKKDARELLPCHASCPTIPLRAKTVKNFGGALIIAFCLELTNPQSVFAQSHPFALAQLQIGFNLPELVANIFRQFPELVGVLETFLADLGIEVSLGELGLPDLEEAEILFEEDNQIDIAGDVFGSQTGSTIDSRDKLYQQYLRDLGKEFSQNSALTIEGQENIMEQIETSAVLTEASLELAVDSTNQDVSQNILRNISNQLFIKQQLDNMFFFERQEDKIARSLALSVNGESLIELSRQTTRAQREAASLYKASLYNHALLSIPGQYLLND